ncbi:MAG: hypothetical protein L0Y45_05365 [Woeseiaceae bacterium]|nr:hypothetical protein [Woeseiaceae bacterium]
MQEFSWAGCRVIRRGPTAVFLLLMLASCSEPERAAQEIVGPCGSDGGLRAELFGEIEAAIRWRADELKCEGMPRPNAAGARLRFSGPVTNAGEHAQLAFIFGIPGLERGKAARELPTNVTVIDEGRGRFFSTRDTDSCWSDIEGQEETAKASTYIISGILYCVAPLAELNGNGSVTLTEVHFTGLLDWKPPQ